jgi:hypothetical protein
MFSHFLSAFLDYASHDLPSFLFFLRFVIPLALLSPLRARGSPKPEATRGEGFNGASD